ncbi:MAG: hypothetical protein IH950_13605 [Bacteroidetes bacterium]|nr:hypothetical protein [Bacteroidota bacterium]
MKKVKILIAFILSFMLSQSLMAQKEQKSLLTGYGFTNLEIESDDPSQFKIGFNPIFLWSINNNILFESELEFEIEDNSTVVVIEYAQIMYIANAYMTFGAGKFLSPNNIFSERYHPAWINKLPNMPLGLSAHSGAQLLAGTQVGLQVRSGIPVGSSKIVYALYVSNGPALIVDEDEEIHGEGGDEDPHGEIEEGGHHGATGPLSFSNIPDNNSDKAIGGRIGFILFPELEIGYGFETARVGTDDTEFSDVRSFNNVVDLSYVQDIKSLAGKVDVRSQFTWLNVDNPGIDHLNYENNSTAWYAQLAYQPYYVESSFLQNLEFVVRYDQIDLPKEAELNTDQNRITVGLNYWLNHSTVFKFAYGNITSEHEDGSESESTFIFQIAMGF